MFKDHDVKVDGIDLEVAWQKDLWNRMHHCVARQLAEYDMLAAKFNNEIEVMKRGLTEQPTFIPFKASPPPQGRGKSRFNPYRNKGRGGRYYKFDFENSYYEQISLDCSSSQADLSAESYHLHEPHVIESISTEDHIKWDSLFKKLPDFVKKLDNKVWILGFNEEIIPKTVLAIVRLGTDFIIRPSSMQLNKILSEHRMQYKLHDNSKCNPLACSIEPVKQFLQQNQLIMLDTDKNMGPALISTVKYNELAKKILQDETTFISIEEYNIQYEYVELIKKFNYDIVKAIKPDDNQLCLASFTGMPKVHKVILALRPVVNASNIITTKLSKLLNVVLSKMLDKLNEANPFNVCSADAYITKLKEFNKNNCNKITLDALDIKSLYTNIRLDKLREAVDFCLGSFLPMGAISIYFNKSQIFLRSTDIFQLLNLYLEFNFVTFDGKIFKQIKGVPTGGNVSPTLAMMTLSYYELEFKQNERQMWELIKNSGRYLDDWIIIYTGTNYDRELYSRKLYGEELELEPSEAESVNSKPFLDLRVTLKSCGLRIKWKLFRKLNNAYCYLHYKSYIPVYVKKGFIIGEIIRIYRRNLYESDSIREVKFFFDKLKLRGYPSKFIQKQIQKATAIIKGLDTSNDKDHKNDKFYIMPYIEGMPKHEILDVVNVRSTTRYTSVAFTNHQKLKNKLRWSLI